MKNLNKLAVAALFLLGSGAFASTEYTIDSAHSEVGFSVTHLMISKVRGRFNKFEGKFNFDEAKKELSNVDVKIDVASVDTNEKKRDEHLTSGDFFDAKEFPTMTFKTEKVEKIGKKSKLIGTLTIHGKSQKVTLDVEYKGSIVDPMGNNKVGFAATGKINRKDFGINWNKSLDKGGVALGDEVTITIEGEAAAAKS